MNIIQKIFSDHFHTVASSGISIRDTVFENVDKMLHCGDYSQGYTLYFCEHCGTFKHVPFRCKRRFCTSCGTLYSIKHSTSMSFKLINTSHRHCVFTIPEQLRSFFLKDRSLLDCLFKSVADCIFFTFRKLNKTENFTLGFICVLHTFGRNLQWNPHIHVLIIVTKTMLLLLKPFLLQNLSKNLLSTSRKSILKWSDIMVCMLNIINTKTNSLCLLKRKRDTSSSPSTSGKCLFCGHLASIHFCASAVTLWPFLKFAIKALRYLKFAESFPILPNFACPSFYTLKSFNGVD